jgi:hypothetical protein
MAPKDFTDMVNLRNPEEDNVVTMLYGPDDISLRIYNDRAPKYWTTYDDEYVIFDSWDSDEETTIVANKTQVFVTKEKSFDLSDDAVIDLPSNLVQYLLAMAEAKYKADNQIIDPKVEQAERRQRLRSMRNKWRQGRMKYEGPDFGK